MWRYCKHAFVDSGDLDIEAQQLEKYQKQLKKQLRMLDQDPPRLREKDVNMTCFGTRSSLCMSYIVLTV